MPEQKHEPKKLYQKLNYVADWIIRLIIVNFLTILMALPIVTIVPALTSAYHILSDALNKDETPIFKSYFSYFKEDIANKIITSIIIVAILVISIYNNRLYGLYIEQGKGIMYTIGYYITLTIIIATVMIALYLPLVFTERKERDLETVIKLAFYLSGKYFFRTMFVAMTLLIPFLMLTNQVTFLLFIFFGTTLPLLIIAAITLKPRRFLQETKGNQ